MTNSSEFYKQNNAMEVTRLARSEESEKPLLEHVHGGALRWPAALTDTAHRDCLTTSSE